MNGVTDHLRDPVVIIKSFIGFLILSGLFALIPLVYSMLEEQFTPIDYWFEYHSIKPTKLEYCAGEEIRFITHRAVYRETHMKWNDALYCDLLDGEGFGTYSLYESGRVLAPEVDKVGHWTYGARVPVQPAVCYLKSDVTAKLKYSSKTQYLVGPEFKIVDCN